MVQQEAHQVQGLASMEAVAPARVITTLIKVSKEAAATITSITKEALLARLAVRNKQ